MSRNPPTSRFVIIILTFLTLHPQNTIQQTTIDDIQTIEATCYYSLDSQNTYTCNLLDAVILEDSDVLNITGAHIDDLTDDDVLIVNYHNTTSKYFKGEVLIKFKNLQTLKLMGQRLEDISDNAFEVCHNLMILNIQFNDLTALPTQMLKNCEKLIIFKLTHTSLSEIPEDLFGSTKNLEDLIISNNQLTSLPKKLLQNMEKLKFFDAGSNFLTELSPDLFINCLYLRHVDLSYNNFEDQGKISAISGHINLYKFWLNFNSFSNFDFNFFSQFENLEELTIGSTDGPKLTEISWQSLPSSLISLIIYGIGEDIPENSFDHLRKLESLSLSGKDIENLHKDTFKSLTKLEVISIQGTSIKTLDPELFINQAALSDLNLRDNKIAELPSGIFTKLVNLGIKSEYHGIKMSFNNIQRLNSNSFGQHPHLHCIDFSSNKIIAIELGIFSKFNSNLTYVDFYYNLCVDEFYVYPRSLDVDESLATCYVNWIGTTTTGQSTTQESEPTTMEPTTPGGSGNNFKYFEVFFIIFVGFFLMSTMS